MANNRMSLKCDVCDERFLLAKYYPTITDGWFLPAYPPDGYAVGDERAGEGALAYCKRFEAFLEAHSYCDSTGIPTNFGNRKFSLVFEVPDGS